MIKLEHVSVTYDKRKVVDDFSFNFAKTGFYAIVGDSGSGKTTLLNLMSGLENNYQGRISAFGKDLAELNEEQKANLRLNNFGFIHQFHHLFPFDSVYRNVSITLDACIEEKEKVKKQKVDDLLEMLHIKALKNKSARKLSGGEKARVSSARALANDPKILLLDEPTGGLDKTNADEMMQLLYSLKDQMLIILISHDLELVNKYVPEVIAIKDGKIVDHYINEIIDEDEKKISLIRFKRSVKNTPQLKLSFMFRHFYHTFKEKKWRFLLSHTMTSLALLGIGLSISLTSLISSHMELAYSRIFQSDQLSVTAKNQIETTNKIDALNYEEVNDIETKFDEVIGIGAYYNVNFEMLFPDINEFSYQVNTRYVKLNGYSVRHINEYLPLDYIEEKDDVYPKMPSSLEDDEIIISLPYVEMVNMCYVLKIKTSYQDLGMYIANNELYVTLNLANGSIGYEDQQIFKVRAIVALERYQIFQDNSLWNEYVFEDMMLMDITYEWSEVLTLPWIMQKAYYVSLRNYQKFYKDVRNDEKYAKYVFDWMGERHYLVLSEFVSSKELRRALVFKQSLDNFNVKEIIDMIDEDPSISGYIFCSAGGYVSYPQDMMMGFANRTLFAGEDENLNLAIDAYSNFNASLTEEILLPDGVEEGYYPKTTLGGVSLQPQSEEKIDGVRAQNEDEIVISSALANSLFNDENILGKQIYIASCIEEYYTEDGRVHRDFKKTSLKVTGIIQESNLEIYHDASFSLDFFRFKLGISEFDLIPNGAIIEVKDESKIDEVKLKLSNNYPNYDFLNPLSTLEEEVKSITTTISIILLAFSLIAIISSVFLLSVLIHLNIHDYRKDIGVLKLLGFPQLEIRKLFILNSVFFSLFAFVFAFVELVVLSSLITYILSMYFMTPFIFSLELISPIVMLVVALSISVFTSLKESKKIEKLHALEALKG